MWACAEVCAKETCAQNYCEEEFPCVVHIKIGGNSYLIGEPIAQGFREQVTYNKRVFQA